jgi:hypothetical protein
MIALGVFFLAMLYIHTSVKERREVLSCVHFCVTSAL